MTTTQALRIALALSAFGMASACAPLPPARADLYGTVAAGETATRSITLRPGARYVNVTSGETVAFRGANRTVAWTFMTTSSGRSAVALNFLLPDLPEAKGITAIIAPSPLYRGSS
ncbi:MULTISPECIES: CzcE family metal-binding protein [Cupriavidus]|uniref:CzcE family metal-binding protein n=1 Tax=Cupriavidus TaxID=106589 RepID=UPI001580C16D|nr:MULTISPECIES: CzcE family metal-binding protein [Cupriavidus]MBO4120594.1 CzcE family metal-binding protein [Cupriavidus gilardii]QKS64837.1 CzcE family metal-binding protein [Cupriavidus gilardii]